MPNEHPLLPPTRRLRSVRRCSGWRRWVEDRGDQFGVEVPGEFAELAVCEPADIAVLVAVALSPPGVGVAAALDHDPLTFGDEPLRGVAVAVSELREQRPQQLFLHLPACLRRPAAAEHR